MITEIIRSESTDRITTVRIEKYNRVENVHVSTNLGEKSVEDYIKDLEERFKGVDDDLILLAVKLILPERAPSYMSPESPLKNVVTKLNDIKTYLENNSLREVHLSNLPCWFWEDLGECIDDVKKCYDPQPTWDVYRKLNSNVWGFKIVNHKYFLT